MRLFVLYQLSAPTSLNVAPDRSSMTDVMNLITVKWSLGSMERRRVSVSKSHFFCWRIWHETVILHRHKCLIIFIFTSILSMNKSNWLWIWFLVWRYLHGLRYLLFFASAADARLLFMSWSCSDLSWFNPKINPKYLTPGVSNPRAPLWLNARDVRVHNAALLF